MLVLSRVAYEDMLTHARADAPRECCGVLVGSSAGEATTVTDAFRTENAAETPRTAYEIAPRDVLALAERAECGGREIVGFYHSHPDGPPGLSVTDEREATWMGAHYLLVSLGGPRPVVDAWRWTDEGFTEDAVVVRRVEPSA